MTELEELIQIIMNSDGFSGYCEKELANEILKKYKRKIKRRKND